MQFRKSIALFDSMMEKPQQKSESPRRKMPRPSLPPEDQKMSTKEDSEEEQEYEDNSYTNNKAPKSDDKMKVVAGGN